MTTGICTATRALRRRSLFIRARAARKLDLARSLDTGLYSTKCAPISNTAFSPMMGSTMATATACLLQGALRALRSTSMAPSSVQSTMIASNRWRVSLRNALSESAHNSTAISRSPSTRRNTRTIFSSEHSTNDFRLMAGAYLSTELRAPMQGRCLSTGLRGSLVTALQESLYALYVHRPELSTALLWDWLLS